MYCILVSNLPSLSPLPPLPYTDRPNGPSNISLSSDTPLQLSLSWTQPYSHPNITLSYIITITTIDSESGAIIGTVRSEAVQNTTTYIFKPDSPSCDRYSFTIAAINDAGHSETSTPIAGTLPMRMSMYMCTIYLCTYREHLVLIFLYG